MLLGKQQQANYANVQVTANASVSSSFELICMLHERLIQELESVKFSIETKDLELKSNATQKSIDILVGLDASLDLSTGKSLSKTYTPCMSTPLRLYLRRRKR